MPSTFPNTPDDLGRDGLTHGDVSDALAAVETVIMGLLAGGSKTAILTDYSPPPTDGSLGEPGDYYYDANASDFYGPRSTDGSWPFLATFGLSGVNPQYIESAWTFGGEPINAFAGILLTSPNHTQYRLAVADDGSLSTTPA